MALFDNASGDSLSSLASALACIGALAILVKEATAKGAKPKTSPPINKNLLSFLI